MKPTELTASEWKRVRATLLRIYKTNDYPQVVDVTVGNALIQSKGRADPERGWAARFHVQRKLARPPSGTRLPTTVTVRFRRNNKLEEVTLPTDIIELRGLTATGADLFMPRVGVGAVEPATGGLLFEWEVTSTGGPIPYQGLLTVGHSCDPPQQFSTFGGPVAVVVPGQTSLGNGRMFAQSMHMIDAALTTVDVRDLTVPMFHPIRRLPELEQDQGRRGATLRASGKVGFRVLTPPQNVNLSNTFPWNGMVRNVIEVEADEDDAFAPGTSGSVWVVEDDQGMEHAAMIQLGAWDNGYRIGIGQVIDQTLLPWAIERIKARPGVNAASVRCSGGF